MKLNSSRLALNIKKTTKMEVLGPVSKTSYILLVLLTLLVLVEQSEAVTDDDYRACLTPCVLTFANDSKVANSDEQMCTMSTVLINCITSNCKFKERNIPPVLYDYLQSVYNQEGFSCVNYTAKPDYVPIGVDQLISVLQEVFTVLFTKCNGFEDCLTTVMVDNWKTNTQPCIINRALKTCINDMCVRHINTSVESFEETRDNLLNTFFRKMELRGFRCDKDGLHSWTTPAPQTMTTTTTTLSAEEDRTEYPLCSAGINWCDRTACPAVIGCRVQHYYRQCVIDECGFVHQKLPDFLLHKLERDRKEMGFHCNLVTTNTSNKAADQTSPAIVLTATLLTVLVVLFVL